MTATPEHQADRRFETVGPRLVSVVIPNLNGAATLGFQLEGLAAQTYPGDWEVIVSDNGSTDGSMEIADQWVSSLPDIRVVDAADRRSANHARNVGAAAARGELILFCDNDDVVAPGWVAAMVEAAREFDVIGGWQDHELLNDTTTYAFAPYRPAKGPASLPPASGFLPFAVSCTLGVHASVFHQLGGFNPEYIVGGDDVEFSWRAVLAGYRLGLAPDAVVHYRWRGSFRQLARQVFRWGMEGARLFRDFKERGMPRSDTGAALKDWGWILVHVANLVRSPRHKGAWIRRAAYRGGRIRGSVRYGVFYL